MICRRLAVLTVVVVATLGTQPASASAIQTLDITEYSSTNLTAVLNGTTNLSVTPQPGGDAWFFQLVGISEGEQNWLEPDNSGNLNEVATGDIETNGVVEVFSDKTFPGLMSLTDGTPDTTTWTLNGQPLSVTFHDLGDTANGVPDTGSTVSLVVLALAALFGATRLRSFRVA